MARLKDKVAIVTGGASGIGASTVRRFMEEGAKVVLADVNVEAGQACASELGESVVFEKLDVSNEDNWIEVVNNSVERFGGLAVLVNCAGVNAHNTIEEETLEGWRKTFALHADGTFLGCKYAFPHLKKAKSASIINFSSNGAAAGYAKVLSYGAAKSAVHGLTRSIAAHCRQRNYLIRCNAVLPGAAATPMVHDVWASMPGMTDAMVSDYVNRIGTPEDVANVCLFLASDEGRYINGQSILVDGGMTNSVNTKFDDRLGPGMSIDGPMSAILGD